MKRLVSLSVGTLLFISSLHASTSYEQDPMMLELNSEDKDNTEIELGRFGAKEKTFGFSTTIKMGYDFEYLGESLEASNINLSIDTLRLTVNYMW